MAKKIISKESNSFFSGCLKEWIGLPFVAGSLPVRRVCRARTNPRKEGTQIQHSPEKDNRSLLLYNSCWFLSFLFRSL